jgi:hypothetical protein
MAPCAEARQPCREGTSVLLLGEPYLASKDDYQDQILATGFTVGTPVEALDCAAWPLLRPP